jgi:hypothetical protein
VHEQQREAAPLRAALPWDGVRRAREPIAWALLVLTAIGLLIGLWELFGLRGTEITGPVPYPFAFRASVIGPQFVALDIVALPVLSVILVAFTGGLTDHARQVVHAAVFMQAVALGLGMVCWLAALGAPLQPGVGFVANGRELAIAAVALIFTAVVNGSQALQPLMPFEDFRDDEEDDSDSR